MVNDIALDLHGTKHKEVFNIVDKFIGDHLLRGTPYVQIITGRSEKMKHLVKRVLDDYEMYAQEHILNSGILTVDLT